MVIGDYAYVGTGINNGVNKADFWRFNPTSGTWTQMNDLDADASYTIVRSGSTTFTLNGKGYLGTGYSSGYTADFWEYDPTEDIWTQVTSFEGSARSDAIGFTIGDKGYVATGQNGSYHFDDIWSFDPNADYNGDD